jgi:CheY-like chemotaxis protein
MDMQMPEMDGLEATRRIRAANKTLPIIAMTANVYADDRQRCADAGMNDFIAKPIDPELVFSTLLKWLPTPTIKPADETPAPLLENVPTETFDQLIIARLSAIPGLDVSRGIAIVRGKTTKYVDLLSRFIEGHAQDMDRLVEYSKAGDHPKAVMLAHSLKGAAATLGITNLAEAAKHIELMERAEHHPASDDIEMQTEMETVRHEFVNISAALHATLALTQANTKHQMLDTKAAKALFDELEKRLEDDNFTAIALFQEHGETLRAMLGNQSEDLARQIRQFDFENARKTLHALRSKG